MKYSSLVFGDSSSCQWKYESLPLVLRLGWAVMCAPISASVIPSPKPSIYISTKKIKSVDSNYVGMKEMPFDTFLVVRNNGSFYILTEYVGIWEGGVLV